ncbi:MAG: POTRA domain-containing protein, partial [Vicinamibacterales bacterium]
RVTEVAFRGELAVATRHLRDALAGRALGAPTADRVGAAVRALRAFYLARGHFGATVEAQIDAASAPARSRLVFSIRAGPRARVGKLDVEADGVTPSEVLSRLGLQTGQPWDETQLAERTRRYTDALREQGRYEANVAWSLARDAESNTIDVTIEARLGPLVELVFDTTEVPERRLRELVPIVREGAIDEDLLEDSKRRIEASLRAQGYARAVVEYERQELTDRLRVTFHVRRGPLLLVDGVELEGVAAERLTEVRALIQLPVGTPFSQDALNASVAAIEQHYRLRGFGGVQVASTLEGDPGGVVDAFRVRPRIDVTEGARTIVGRVALNGVSAVRAAELRPLLALRTGAPFHSAQLLADRDAVSAFYQNRGFRDARIDVLPAAAEAPGQIDLTYEITEGPQQLVGHVLIAGNSRTGTETITRELGLVAGTPLGLDDLADAQRRLSALGLFRRVTVDALPQPGRRDTDVTVTVDEAPPTTLGYGIGLEGGRRLVRDEAQSNAAVETIEISPRGFFEIGRRNLWGKNRSVNLYTRFSLRDRGGSAGSTSNDSAFYEFRVVGTYREPRVLDTLADAQINAFVEQGVRSSFNFARQGINAEMARRLGPRTTVAGRYTFGKTRLFDQRLVAEEKPIIDRLYPQLRLSTLSTTLVNDARNDPLDPSAGYVVNSEADVAFRAIGSEVGFVKGFFQGFLYRRVPGFGGAVLAAGARLGAGSAFGLDVPDDNQPSARDLPASERFYAGGSTTVRGYALDRLGDSATIDSDGFPRGGNAMVIFNGELRFPVRGPFGGVVFVDSGNVFARLSDLDVTRIRSSTGAGLRYRSPIGPIRVDVGIKLDPRQQVDGVRERRWEVHISLGQAF